MDQIAPARTKPPIVIGDADHRSLVSLALAMEKGVPEVSEALLDELDRARVVPQAEVPARAVQMGSTVRFEIKGAGERQVVLVVPGDADIDAGRISVMTPIGAALIGLSAGQSMRWHTRDGREQELTVLDVEPPAEAT